MSKHIEDIMENYLKMEKEIVTELNYEVTTHYGTAGTNREEIWKELFRRIVPKKFNITRSVFIIDSNGNASKEVDIAIYDEQYTPYIFNYGTIKFIPIEAVAAVVQCKSKTLTCENLKEWVSSIENLKTSTNSYVRLATNIHIGNDFNPNSTQNETKPIKILCHISKTKNSKRNSCRRELFDIVINAYQNAYQNSKKQNKESYSGNLDIAFKDNNLFEILEKYNGVQNKEKNEKKEKQFTLLKNAEIKNYSIKNYNLLSFIFQFNQMLMMINNPMFFPHLAYVKMFNK